ncbi:MAG TPA: hypothetical protein VFS83_04350 [Ktedonobacterales bacterium]|nr:hypothetical protein [Ktedonobacterales bacterium]
MNPNFQEDGRRQAMMHQALGAMDDRRELRESAAEENLAMTASTKARRQRTIGIALFLVALAALAAYLIVRILGM